MRAARPMGVYYNMPFDDYHAVDAVSASGLLCRACNTMLGAALDVPETLRLGAAYLERA